MAVFYGIMVLIGWLFIPLHLIFKKQEEKYNLITGFYVIYGLVFGSIILLWGLYIIFLE
jgi:hypothetical protein